MLYITQIVYSEHTQKPVVYCGFDMDRRKDNTLVCDGEKFQWIDGEDFVNNYSTLSNGETYPVVGNMNPNDIGNFFGYVPINNTNLNKMKLGLYEKTENIIIGELIKNGRYGHRQFTEKVNSKSTS